MLSVQVIAEYGSTWCAHCQEMFPHFQQLAKQVSPAVQSLLFEHKEVQQACAILNIKCCMFAETDQTASSGLPVQICDAL